MYKVGADIDHSHPEAREDIIKWGKWIIEEVGASGFRFDAVKVCTCPPVTPPLPAPSLPPPLLHASTFLYADHWNWLAHLPCNVVTAHRQRLHRRLHQDGARTDEQTEDVRRGRVLEG